MFAATLDFRVFVEIQREWTLWRQSEIFFNQDAAVLLIEVGLFLAIAHIGSEGIRRMWESKEPAEERDVL